MQEFITHEAKSAAGILNDVFPKCGGRGEGRSEEQPVREMDKARREIEAKA